MTKNAGFQMTPHVKIYSPFRCEPLKNDAISVAVRLASSRIYPALSETTNHTDSKNCPTLKKSLNKSSALPLYNSIAIYICGHRPDCRWRMIVTNSAVSMASQYQATQMLITEEQCSRF